MLLVIIALAVIVMVAVIIQRRSGFNLRRSDNFSVSSRNTPPNRDVDTDNRNDNRNEPPLLDGVYEFGAYGTYGQQFQSLMSDVRGIGAVFFRGPNLGFLATDAGIGKRDEYQTKFLPALTFFSQAGLEPVPVIASEIYDTTRPAGSGGVGTGGATLPDDIPLWQSFIKKAVSENKDISAWQLEFEYPRVWFSERNSPETYVQHLKNTYEALKAGNPQAKLIIGGFANLVPSAFCDGYIDTASIIIPSEGLSPVAKSYCATSEYQELKRWTEYPLLNGRQYFDIVDAHFYGDYQYIDEQVRWLNDKLGGSKKDIWSLESGGPFTLAGESYSQSAEAAYVVKRYTVAFASGVRRLVTHSDVASGNWGQPFKNLGMFDADKNKKPAYFSYQQLNDKIKGFSSVQNLNLSPKAYSYQFVFDRKSVYILWSEENAAVRLPVASSKVSVTDVITSASAAERTRTISASSGTVELRLTSVPVYVVEERQ